MSETKVDTGALFEISPDGDYHFEHANFPIGELENPKHWGYAAAMFCKFKESLDDDDDLSKEHAA